MKLNGKCWFCAAPAGSDFVAVEIGHGMEMNILALRTNGSVVRWGTRFDYEIPTGYKFVDIAAGELHCFALTPEPSTILLFGLGGLFLRKRKDQ